MTRRLAVVGASLAGLSAAERLVQLQPDAEVHLFDAQAHLPYDKPPLSKRAFLSPADHQEIALRDEAYWAKSGITSHFGVRATGLDAQPARLEAQPAGSVTLHTGDGEAREFDGIIVATGGRPRTAPFARALPGTHELRTIEDAVSLHNALRPGSKLVIIGGGFIGLEVASVAVGRGVNVTVVEPGAVPLQRPVGAHAGGWITERHREHGVEFVTAGVSALLGNDRVTGVQLADGQILEADQVLVSIGMVPNVEWLQPSGIEIDNGVSCDATLATSLQRVFAAGDIANWPNPQYARRMRVEHHTTAVSQGQAAAANLVASLGGSNPAEFRDVPYVWSDQYDMKIQTVGMTGQDFDTRVISESPEKLTIHYLQDDAVVGALAVNSPAFIMKLRRQLTVG